MREHLGEAVLGIVLLRYSLFLISLAVTGPVAAGQEPEVLHTFRSGERLVYDVTWLGIGTGEAVLEIQGVDNLDGRQAYRLVSTVRSGRAISKIYEVDDRTESLLEADPLRTLRFDKNLREGRFRHSSRTVFDQEQGLARLRRLDFGRVPRNVTRLDEAERFGTYVSREFPLSPGALDELSVLYYVRTLPLEASTTVTARVFASKRNWELEVRVLGREALASVLGRRATVKVEPVLKQAGMGSPSGRIVVWLTDDAERIPLQMKSEIVIGSVVATLRRRDVGSSRAGPDPRPGSTR